MGASRRGSTVTRKSLQVFVDRMGVKHARVRKSGEFTRAVDAAVRRWNLERMAENRARREPVMERESKEPT